LGEINNLYAMKA